MYAWMFETSEGWMAAACSETGLTDLSFPEEEKNQCARLLVDMLDGSRFINQPPGPDNPVYHLGEALDEYYAGRLKTLNFPVDRSVYTPFQRAVLEIVREIPYGALLTYGQVAAMAGYPRSARAAGGALRANRVPLVIPCHRVVQGDGSPGGFGGRPWIKMRLLALEGHKIDGNGRYSLHRRPEPGRGDISR